MKPLRVGTRQSPLALQQAEWVSARLRADGVSIELVPIASLGDIVSTTPLYLAESVGVFTKELESALLERKIDLAVHSLKDLPTLQPDGLEVVAVPEREATSDVLVVSKQAMGTGVLPLRRGAIVGTSSLRREAQLYSVRPDLVVRAIRGNLGTRIQKVISGEFDATVLARAGLLRTGFESHEVDLFELPNIPAPGQGALAVEARSEDVQSRFGLFSKGVMEAILHLEHEPTRRAVTIERTVLRGLEGGCTLPLGVRVETRGESLHLKAFLGRLLNVRGEPSFGRWAGFDVFDISGTDDKTLISETVSYLKIRLAS